MDRNRQTRPLKLVKVNFCSLEDSVELFSVARKENRWLSKVGVLSETRSNLLCNIMFAREARPLSQNYFDITKNVMGEVAKTTEYSFI